MQKGLKKEITTIVKALKTAKKYRLSKCLEQNWNKTALSYSKELNTWKPARPMEKELLNAFSQELERLEIKKSLRLKILSGIEKRRILQTAPHLGATENPRMLCINWLGSLGVPIKDFYLVAMFSGVPFSNRSRPGRINKKKDSVNLFPSNLQDALVYRSMIPEKLIESLPRLPESVKKLLPKAVLEGSYTQWALQACASIERKILKRKNLIYLDINEVVSKYLIRVLENENHIFYKIFFDPKTREEFIKVFPNEIMFYSPFLDGKYEKMENIFLINESLKSKHKEISLNNKENLIKELKAGRLCPALLPGFFALAFLNEFKCLGSFAQVEYLPVYQKKLLKLKCLKNFRMEKVPTANLTTGVFPFDPNLYPIDIIMGREKFSPNPKTLVGELLLPMKEVLLESYFTGDNRNNAKK